MGIGVTGGVASSWTGIGGVLGGLTVIHGADVSASGLQELLYGEETPTLTQQGISSGLQVAGVSKAKADYTASFIDAGLGIALSGGAGAAKNGSYVFGKGPLVTATRSAEVGAEAVKTGDNIALGLGNDLFNFAAKKGFKTYRDFSTGFQKEKILEAIENTANNLHFNLTGFSRSRFMRFKPTDIVGHDNVTNWELYTIYNTPGALERTTFYKIVDGVYEIVPKPL
jgi:hypothetical protein